MLFLAALLWAVLQPAALAFPFPPAQQQQVRLPNNPSATHNTQTQHAPVYPDPEPGFNSEIIFAFPAQDDLAELDHKYPRMSITWISAYETQGKLYFALVLEKRELPISWITVNLSRAQLDQMLRTGPSTGRFVSHLTGYFHDGREWFAAIWEMRPELGDQRVLYATDEPTYMTADIQNRKEGYRLKHLDVYLISSNERRFNAVWVRMDPSVSPRDMFHKVLVKSFRDYVQDYWERDGYRVAAITAHTFAAGGPSNSYVTALLEENLGNIRSKVEYYLTSDEAKAVAEKYHYEGYTPVSVAPHAGGGQAETRFTIVWHHRHMDRVDLDAIDNEIAAFMHNHNVPGLSVAIAKNERLIFAKGYGVTDTDTKTPVTIHSRFRLASISKSFTATAIMKRIEQGGPHGFQLNSRVFRPDSLTGDKHKPASWENWEHPGNSWLLEVTVEALLEHQAGWATAIDEELIQLLQTKTPADAIKHKLETVPHPQEHRPGEFHQYSNFGYLVLGQLLDDLAKDAGQDAMAYEKYVKTDILNSKVTNVSTIDLARADNRPLQDEVSYYPPDRLRYRACGAFGGWVGTPIDVLRWGVYYDGLPEKPDLMEPRTEAIMWTPASHQANFYAKGWIVTLGGDSNHHAAYRGHNGLLDNAASFFVQRIDGSGYSFVVCVNTIVDTNFVMKAVIDRLVDRFRIQGTPSWDLFAW